jgi:hypothetical protein
MFAKKIGGWVKTRIFKDTLVRSEMAEVQKKLAVKYLEEKAPLIIKALGEINLSEYSEKDGRRSFSRKGKPETKDGKVSFDFTFGIDYPLIKASGSATFKITLEPVINDKFEVEIKCTNDYETSSSQRPHPSVNPSKKTIKEEKKYSETYTMVDHSGVAEKVAKIIEKHFDAAGPWA